MRTRSGAQTCQLGLGRIERPGTSEWDRDHSFEKTVEGGLSVV